jgi:hypothetical protein
MKYYATMEEFNGAFILHDEGRELGNVQGKAEDTNRICEVLDYCIALKLISENSY